MHYRNVYIKRVAQSMHRKKRTSIDISDTRENENKYWDTVVFHSQIQTYRCCIINET